MLKLITSTILLLLTTTSYAQSSDNLTIDLQELQKPNWTEQELANAELITDFVQNLMNDHNFDYVLEHYNLSLIHI